MRHKRSWVGLILALGIVLAGPAAAQASKPTAPNVSLAPAFTYQGQIRRDGALFTGTCDLQFSLWDSATAGAQQGALLPANAVSIDNGVFTVELNFGNQFKGEARWLEMAAKCADDGSFTTLPRVALNPTPYAIGLLPGGQIDGSIANPGSILNVTNHGTGPGLVATASGNAGLWGNSVDASGVFGDSSNWHGVTGQSTNSVGIFGESTNSAGIWGQTPGDNAAGVAGYGLDPCPAGSPANCTATHSRNATGVYGEAQGNGAGVWGKSINASGVYGESANWHGVSGVSQNAAGLDGQSTNLYGVYGKSTNAIGIYGETSVAHTFTQSGVFGNSTGDGGIGVIGQSNVGSGWGVYGVSASGSGVVGQSTTGYAGYFMGKVGITGGADLAERFATTDGAQVEPGTVMVIDDHHAGKLRVSDSAYDNKVVGIISGAGGINTGLTLHQDGALEGDLVVAIAGRVYCQAEANSAAIKPGDMLTTSAVKGRCMKAGDRAQAYGAVIGKALTGLDQGQGLVLVLVNLQ